MDKAWRSVEILEPLWDPEKSRSVAVFVRFFDKIYF
jgi:hypothetical protein